MPNITLTAEALAAAERIREEQAVFRGLPLRIYIEGKGCDGFYYGVTFAKAEATDITWWQGTIQITIDEQSLSFMQGSVVTWVDDERGQGFLVENPEHRRFRGKFFKKRAWLDKFTSSSQ